MKSITNNYWSWTDSYEIGDIEKELSRQYRVAPEIIKLLANRGVSVAKDIEQFLYPTLRDLPDPFLIYGMEAACQLVYQAIDSKRKILIWGDYDVDGVTGTSLLYNFFTSLGHQPDWYIPNRFTDGYGINISKLDELIDFRGENPLLITVDCGISDIAEIKYAKERGCEIIVTDHHEPGSLLPAADVILNCKMKDCTFPDKNISGVAVAFYFAAGIRAFGQKNCLFSENANIPNMKQLLEFVAIGTVADMVPLTPLNRILVRGGFEVLNTSPSTGMASLLEECHIVSGNITSDDIAFHVAPKINAAGRMDSASLAVEMFIEKNALKAKKFARKLTLLNDKRKALCGTCLETTLTYLDSGNDNYTDVAIILKIDSSLGVIGIVASQLVAKYNVPVILVTECENPDGEILLKGSCRSVPGINIYELLIECSSFLLKFGGHPMAAGITLKESQFASFKKEILEILGSEGKKKVKFNQAEMEISIERAMDDDMINGLQLLEPFGVGNKKPTFVDTKITIQDIRRLGKSGSHISFVKRGRYENMKCIAFEFGDYVSELKERPSYDAVYTVSVSRYKKAVQWQAQIIDIL